jgi:ABC-type nitrate/sulfonate/bicarbonate transport system permease component
VTQAVTLNPARVRLPRGWAEGIAGTVVLLAIWQLLAAVIFTGRHVVPPPSQVAAAMWDGQFYWPNLRVTLWEAVRGWLAGNVAAIVAAVIAAFFPATSRGFQQFGAITYCVPTVAVGPLILILTDPDTTKVAIAALSVFFTSLIAWMTGLRATDQASLDVVRAFGGSRVTELLRVRLRAALPSAGGGLALSAPAAILGAILGEYLGGVSGLGVAMISAEQNFEVPQTWAIGLIATVASGIAYGLILLVTRRLAGDPRLGTAAAAADLPPRRRGLKRLLALSGPAAALAVMVALWALALKVFGLSPYFAKSPAAVWSYLFSGANGAADRSLVFTALWQTLRDALFGWLAGTVAALIGAALLVQVPRLRAGVMPVVMVLRSVPLIAMAPLIALVFGQGTAGVTVIGAVITLVPTLVLVTSGLESTPPQAVELAHAYSMSGLGLLLEIRARYAVPSLFAAARVAMPGSILGAVLAEWLLTGGGIGHLMAVSVINSDFNALWASAVVVSAVSLLLYEVVGACETAAGRALAG